MKKILTITNNLWQNCWQKLEVASKQQIYNHKHKCLWGK